VTKSLRKKLNRRKIYPAYSFRGFGPWRAPLLLARCEAKPSQCQVCDGVHLLTSWLGSRGLRLSLCWWTPSFCFDSVGIPNLLDAVTHIHDRSFPLSCCPMCLLVVSGNTLTDTPEICFANLLGISQSNQVNHFTLQTYHPSSSIDISILSCISDCHQIVAIACYSSD
jgi:hypothetical protein